MMPLSLRCSLFRRSVASSILRLGLVGHLLVAVLVVLVLPFLPFTSLLRLLFTDLGHRLLVLLLRFADLFKIRLLHQRLENRPHMLNSADIKRRADLARRPNGVGPLLRWLQSEV